MNRRGAADLMLILLVVLFLGAAGSGGYAWMLWDEARRLEDQLKQKENDFKKAINTRDDLRDINASGMGAASGEIGTIQTFFHETAKEYKFTISKITPSTGRYKEQWTEQAYRLEVKNLSRQQLGNFIADVEVKKPFLKSKEIRDVKLDENHFIQSATIVFSHYQRIRK